MSIESTPPSLPVLTRVTIYRAEGPCGILKLLCTPTQACWRNASPHCGYTMVCQNWREPWRVAQPEAGGQALEPQQRTD